MTFGAKGFEPAVKLPVREASPEEQLAVIAMCEKFGWEVPVELQQLKQERDIKASAGFQRPPVGTVEQRAAKIKSDATLKADTTEATVVPDFLLRQNAVEQSGIQKEIDRLQRKPESA